MESVIEKYLHGHGSPCSAVGMTVAPPVVLGLHRRPAPGYSPPGHSRGENRARSAPYFEIAFRRRMHPIRFAPLRVGLTIEPFQRWYSPSRRIDFLRYMYHYVVAMKIRSDVKNKRRCEECMRTTTSMVPLDAQTILKYFIMSVL